MSLNFSDTHTITALSSLILKQSGQHPAYHEILDEIKGDLSGTPRHKMLTIYITPERQLIYANKRFADLLGYNQEDMVGRDVENFIWRNDDNLYPDWNRTLIPILSNNNIDCARGKHIAKTAEEQSIFFELIYFAYRDVNGQLLFIKGLLQDITSSVIATEKLISEKEKIENILKCGSLGYWVFDTDDRTLSISGNYEALIEYKVSEITDSLAFFRERIHIEDRKSTFILKDESCADDNASVVEFRFLTKSGKYKWLLSKVIGIEYDKKTKHKIVSGIIIDIDNNKKAKLKIREKERKIIQNEESLRRIYQSLPIGIIIYDSQGNYVESNDELLHIFGYQTKKEISKVNLLKLNRHISSLIQNYEYSIDIGYDIQDKTVYPDYTLAPKTQSIRYINIRIISLLDTTGYVNLDNANGLEQEDVDSNKENETGFLLVATDTSILRKAELDLRCNERELKEKNINLSKAKEKAQESDRLKSAFLANVSHEIRTPLNAIIGFSELIATTEDKEEKDLYFEIVKANNDLLLNLINDILDLSKIESGRIELKNTPVNIDRLCTELTEAAKLRGKEGVKIIQKLPEHLISKTENKINYIRQTVLISDRSRISQIYTNLINNAIKNTSKGVIAISYNIVEVNNLHEIIRTMDLEEAESSYNSQIMLACTVSDTGTGIPENKLEEIFNRFTKLDENQNGFGLGLAILKSLVEQMKGYILVKSKVGIGSDFTVLLPYITPEDNTEIWHDIGQISIEELRYNRGEHLSLNLEPAQKKQEKEKLIEIFEKINIKLSNENTEEDYTMGDKMLDILVAEDIDFNYMLVKAIIGKKHNLVRAKTGLEAVELFKKQPFHLILMDMKMPEMDGITATRLIREINQQIPIIAVTAYAFDTDKQIALEAGCNSYIVKPIDPKILIAEIERYA